jgi:dual specificity phosphatase 3
MYDVSGWHRQLCLLTDQIIISGDLSEDPGVAAEQVDHWERVGVTHVLDTRSEWSDKDLVADLSPGIVYGWIPTDDYGFPQPDGWFDDGVAFAVEALIEPDTVVLVHCHMGINRGPSMAYRILLELGWDPIEALDAIRKARPIADIAYAGDALDHSHRRGDVPRDIRKEDLGRLEAWKRGYSTTGLHRMRSVQDGPTSDAEPNKTEGS